MSKHQKHVRRERKKTDRARRLRDHFRHPTSHIRHGGAAALAAAAAIAAGTSAYADPVRYDNPPGAGHFDWTATGGDNEVLSVIDDASSQTGVPGDVGVFIKSLDGYGAGEVVDGGLGGGRLQGKDVGGYGFLDGVDSGVTIPTLGVGLSFTGGGYIYATGAYAYYYAGIRTLLPDGVPTYLGVKFDLGSGDQYGWIGVVRTGQTTDAFAWGYETDPGVPIGAGIPEPGTLAMLAVGAAAVARRRRRAAE